MTPYRVVPWLTSIIADVRIKVIVSVISGMLLVQIPTIIGDMMWVHTSRLDTTAVVRDFPIQKTLIAEKFETLGKQLEHLTMVVEKLNDNIQSEREARLKERRHR